MLYQILLCTVTYCAGAGALSWWLGGVFKRERTMLGFTVGQLTEVRESIDTQRAIDARRDASALAEAMSLLDATPHDDPQYCNTA